MYCRHTAVSTSEILYFFPPATSTLVPTRLPRFGMCAPSSVQRGRAHTLWEAYEPDLLVVTGGIEGGQVFAADLRPILGGHFVLQVY